MIVIPAIDLINGQVVRLFQGDYNKQEIFGKDPVAFAKQFEAAGAKWLHLVDLDGAKAGRPCNVEAIRAIAENTELSIELGGGLRDEKSVELAFSLGVQRVILGTAALRDPDWTKTMVERYQEKIAVGVDARDGKVAIEGWLSTSETDSFDFCVEMKKNGVKHIVYTDISKDGAGQGTNLEIYKKLQTIEGLFVTASGGVTSFEDINALRELQLYGAIVGKALYAGNIELSKAIEAAGKGGNANGY